MNLLRTRAMARKEWIQIRRDPLNLAMAFLMPVILLLIYAYAITFDVNQVLTVVYDSDGSSVSRELIARFERSSYFTTVAYLHSYDEIDRYLDAGRARVALVIPSNFAKNITTGKSMSVEAIIDGSESNTATIVLGYIAGIAQQFTKDMGATPVKPPTGSIATLTPALSPDGRGGTRKQTIEGSIEVEGATQASDTSSVASIEGEAPTALPVEGATQAPLIDVRPRVWYNPELKSRNFIIPGLIAIIMSVIISLLTSLTIAREWDRGTMEQLISTPVKPAEMILGKLTPYFVIGVVDTAIAVVVSTLLLDVPLRGSITLLFTASAIFLFGGLSFGILLSIAARNQLVASQIAMLTSFLPSFLLSGFIFSIINMPKVLQGVTYLVPARYFVTILKGVFLKGVGIEVLLVDMLLLGLYAVLVFLLARKRLQKRID